MYILTPYIGVVCVEYIWLSDSLRTPLRRRQGGQGGDAYE